jgi:hypothetical protein
MIAQHMRFTAAAVLPTGDFLAHVGDWTGLPPSELLGLMRGSAVVSAGGSDEMERLKKAFPQDTSAGKILESDGDPAQVLASLRSLGGEAGAAVSGYLDLVGNRLIDGFDISELSALWSPEKLRLPRMSTPALPKFAPWFPRRTRTSLTNCSARLASLTASVTSVASTATYGPRVSCGAPPLRLAGGSRIVAASSTPIRCWTPA